MPPELESQVLILLGEIKGEVKGINSRLDRMDELQAALHHSIDGRMESLEKKCLDVVLTPPGEPFSKKAAAVATAIGTAIATIIAAVSAFFAAKAGGG